MARNGKGPDVNKLKLFLCGDVMTGRGIDQILPQPSSPEIYESYLTSAEQYIEVAELISGPIPRPVDYDYIWGDALDILKSTATDIRIVNLETSITTSNDNWPNKRINYRMHPGNLEVLSVAGIDCCVLANNHVLDWGYAGLEETLLSLHRAGFRTAGAGRDYGQAVAPAVLDAGKNHRVIVFSMGFTTSGIARAWAAGEGQPGVWLIEDFSIAGVESIGNRVGLLKKEGDIVIASIHWGGNWGYGIPDEMRRFAHALVDRAGVDLLHGHSSHHPRGIEVYKNKLILYGCGDFINDYEGIRGHEQYRDDLRLMFFPEIDRANAELTDLSMRVLQTHRFRLRNASAPDAKWLAAELDRESRLLGGTGVEFEDGVLRLKWQ